MNKNQDNTSLVSQNHSQLIMSSNVPAIISAAVFFIVGIILIIIGYNIDSTILDMLFLTFGVILLVTGILQFIFKRKAYKYKQTRSIVKNGELYFDSKDMATMETALDESDFSKAEGVEMCSLGNARLEYLVSKDGAFVAAQLFRYALYNYQKESEIYYFTDKAAKMFIKYFLRKKH